jgi:integrase
LRHHGRRLRMTSDSPRPSAPRHRAEHSAGRGRVARRPKHALISLLALVGLRVSEAIGVDIEPLDFECEHRILVITARARRLSSRSGRGPRGRSSGHRGTLREHSLLRAVRAVRENARLVLYQPRDRGVSLSGLASMWAWLPGLILMGRPSFVLFRSGCRVRRLCLPLRAR